MIWFHKKLGNRKVVLLLDNFSAHECAVAELKTENLILKIKILWLPPDTIAKYQPMDQRIIRTWKAHYRRLLMWHMIKSVEQGPNIDPYTSVNILHAVRWGIEAWKTRVQTTTIQHCFRTSQVKVHGPAPSLISNDIQDIEDDIYECIRVVHPGLQLSNTTIREEFIHPVDEYIEDAVNNIEANILASYTPVDEDEPEPESQQPFPPPPITSDIALDGLENLLLFSLQFESTPHIQKLQDILYHEKRRIESLQIQTKT